MSLYDRDNPIHCGYAAMWAARSAAIHLPVRSGGATKGPGRVADPCKETTMEDLGEKMEQKSHHSAHAAEAKLTQEQAQTAFDTLDNLDASDEGDAHVDMMDTLELIAGGDEEANFTPEMAKLGADFLREHGSDEHEGVTKTLDAVATQAG